MTLFDFFRFEAKNFGETIDKAKNIINEDSDGITSIFKAQELDRLRTEIAVLYLQYVNTEESQFCHEHLLALRQLNEKVRDYEQIIRNCWLFLTAYQIW